LNTIARKPGHDKDTADRPLNRPKRIAIVFPRVRAEFIESRQETDMTQTNNRFFDEIGRLMNDAAGAAQGVKREFDTVMRTQAEKFLRDMDLVKREEFEAVKDMARLARRLRPGDPVPSGRPFSLLFPRLPGKSPPRPQPPHPWRLAAAYAMGRVAAH
jgi:BMFP domain-containing protein YqiC